MTTIFNFLRKLIFLLFVFLATSCQRQNADIAPVAPKPFHEYISCQFPCWQGITPNKTTLESVREIANKSYEKIHDSSDYIEFRQDQFMQTYVEIGNSGIVQMMQIKLYDYSLSLKDFFLELGQPDGIWVHNIINTDYCVFDLMYVNLGVVIETARPENENTGQYCFVNVNDAVYIDVINIYGENFPNTFYIKDGRFLNWEGYKKYP